MNMIAAIDSKNGIGRNGHLLYRIKEDMKRFRLLTLSNIVIMGKNTLDSLPGRIPLSNRMNFVLTHDTKFTCPGCAIFHDVESVLASLNRYYEYSQNPIFKEAFVIGGGQIYKQFIDYCDTLYLTLINADGHADTFFPDINPDIWKRSEDEESEWYHDDDYNVDFKFTVYRKK